MGISTPSNGGELCAHALCDTEQRGKSSTTTSPPIKARLTRRYSSERLCLFCTTDLHQKLAFSHSAVCTTRTPILRRTRPHLRSTSNSNLVLPLPRFGHPSDEELASAIPALRATDSFTDPALGRLAIAATPVERSSAPQDVVQCA